MYVILFRVIITFIIVLILIRFMGKRQLGELQPFELVITLIVADVATLPMSEPSMPLLNGLIPLIALVLLQYFMSVLSTKSIKFRKLVNGKPIIVIDGNGINYENLKALNMSIDDLQEALRSCQVYNFDMVQYAIIETNGKTSVVFKSYYDFVSKSDMNIDVLENSLPLLLISEGKFMNENLQIVGLTEKEIIKFVKDNGYKNIDDILFMNIDNNGKVYLQPKKGKYQTIIYENFKGGNNWWKKEHYV